jgi:hypothetical protein
MFAVAVFDRGWIDRMEPFGTAVEAHAWLDGYVAALADVQGTVVGPAGPLEPRRRCYVLPGAIEAMAKREPTREVALVMAEWATIETPVCDGGHSRGQHDWIPEFDDFPCEECSCVRFTPQAPKAKARAELVARREGQATDAQG